MSRKFLVNLDLTQNQLLNAAIQNLATAPSSPVTGQVYYNTTTKALYIYDGTNWDQAGGITYGTLSARPTASSVSAGTFYYATDNYLLYFSNASTWQQVDNFGAGQSTTISIAGSAADGTSTNFARADHAHAGPGFGAPTAQTSFGASSTTGTATTVAHSDHTHGTPSLGSATPSAIVGTTGTTGTSSNASHDDHVHGFTPADFTLDQFAVPVANVSLNGYKITNLATPTASTDAANKSYVDAASQGLNVHGSVVVATTANLSWTYAAGSAGADGGTGVGATLTNGSTGTTIIDGHTLILNDRILIKNQSTATQNGIYYVTTAGTTGVATVLTRATDSDNHIAGQVVAGDFVFVATGTTLADTGWVQTNTGTSTNPVNGIKIGTDAIAFTQFSGAGTYLAGNGLSLSGNTFSFNPTSTGGLQAASGGASILLATNSGLGTSSSGLAVGAGTGISVSSGTVAIDTTVVARKYSVSIGDGSATSYTVTHNLGTRDVQVTVYDGSAYNEVIADVTHSTTNTVTVAFSVAPSSNAYRVVVVG